MLVVVILIGALVVALSAAIGWLAVSMGAPVEVGVIIAVIVGAVVALFMFLNMV